MYARGAMPETVRPPEALVPALPAAIPATCVPCPDSSGSKASLAERVLAVGGANARATITFAFVYWSWPFGKPPGIVYPPGAKNA